MSGGGRFDFDDGGTYCGGWEDGKAHGHGVCTGPKGQGEYSGAWHCGFEISGVYTWPSGNSFEGTWTQGKRHGLGIETKGRWVYRGEWTQGFKGRYGARESTNSGAKYEGTWTTGMQDGYGVETYADGGTYQGQWLRGMRHGYGVRQSVPYGLASHYRSKALRTSLTSLRSEAEEDRIVKERDRKIDESRGGFVLKARGDESPSARRRSLFNKKGRSSLRKALTLGLKLRKQKSTGDIQESPRRLTGGSVRSTISNISHVSADSSQSALTNASVYTDGSNLSFISQDDINDPNVTETYTGEWKNDKRSGFGISERSDGLRYEGEWYNNKKYGYGVTTHKDGVREEGKYKNNVLISSGKKSRLFLIRSSKLREQIENAVTTAQRAGQIALQKADIAVSRMANARNKSELADRASDKAKQDSDIARLKAKEYAPEFHQPGTDMMRKRLQENDGQADVSHLTPMSNHNPHHRSRSVMDHTKPAYESDVNATMSPMDMAGSSSRLGGQPYDADRSSQSRLTPNHVGGLGGGGGGPGPGYGFVEEPTQRFSDLLNSTVVSDHFDQYGNLKEDTIGRDIGYRDRRPSRNAGVNFDDGRAATANTATPIVLPSSAGVQPQYISPSPAGGGGHTVDDTECSASRPLSRRKTLPSIIKRSESYKCIAPLPEEATTSQHALNARAGDTYVIENGIRKRVKAEVYARPPRPEAEPTSSSESVDKLRALPKRYRMEKASAHALSSKGPRGSLPDVSQCVEMQKNVMPREEVAKLSAQRREELRLQRERERLRKNREIVLSLADLKDWCQQRQLLMLVIALNVSLATVFFNILQ